VTSRKQPPEPEELESRRDTPRDVPRVTVDAEHVLARTHGLETLEVAYEAWQELRREQAAAHQRYLRERERLEQQGAFLVGSVRSASGDGAPEASASALVPAEGPLRDFLRQAEEKLERARQALAAQEAEREARAQAEAALLHATVRDRVKRHLAAAPPRLRLLLRKVSASRAVLHLERVGGDVPVLLLYLFTGCVPSRHGFLLDDSTDDVSLPPPPLYAEEGVAPGDVRPTAPALRERARGDDAVLPLKGFLPVFVPRPGGGEDFFRLLQRGAVLEVELAEGEGFRGVLTREESERFAGHLLRLNLRGQLVLEVEAD
jgi:hypothetical protein